MLNDHNPVRRILPEERRNEGGGGRNSEYSEFAYYGASKLVNFSRVSSRSIYSRIEWLDRLGGKRTSGRRDDDDGGGGEREREREARAGEQGGKCREEERERGGGRRGGELKRIADPSMRDDAVSECEIKPR